MREGTGRVKGGRLVMGKGWRPKAPRLGGRGAWCGGSRYLKENDTGDINGALVLVKCIRPPARRAGKKDMKEGLWRRRSGWRK